MHSPGGRRSNALRDTPRAVYLRWRNPVAESAGAPARGAPSRGVRERRVRVSRRPGGARPPERGGGPAPKYLVFRSSQPTPPWRRASARSTRSCTRTSTSCAASAPSPTASCPPGSPGSPPSAWPHLSYSCAEARSRSILCGGSSATSSTTKPTTEARSPRCCRSSAATRASPTCSPCCSRKAADPATAKRYGGMTMDRQPCRPCPVAAGSRPPDCRASSNSRWASPSFSSATTCACSASSNARGAKRGRSHRVDPLRSRSLNISRVAGGETQKRRREVAKRVGWRR